MVRFSSFATTNTLLSFVVAVVVVVVVVVDQTAVVSAVFQNMDTCGVTSRDFMNYDYRSDYMVAGSAGCQIGDDNTGCFCAPNLEDEESLGAWQWQCRSANNIVNFGPNPSTGKVCPSTVPVAKGLGDLSWVTDDRKNKKNRRRALVEDENSDSGSDAAVPVVASVGTESQQQKLSVPCNLDIHPSGRPGDEVCPYSDCDEGGEHSAICACIDLAKYGMGDGSEWVCMHATCNCEEISTTDSDGDGTDGDTDVTMNTNDQEVEGGNNLDEDSNEDPMEVMKEDSDVSAASIIASSVVLSFSMLVMAAAMLN